MQAVRLNAAYSIETTQIEYPKREKGYALVAIKAVSICGSDVTAYMGRNPMIKYPRVLGHEAAGEILEIEENVEGLRTGDRVVLEPYVYCGQCYPCTIGRTNCCERLEVLGMSRDGAMTEVLAHPVHLLHRIPDSITWLQASLMEPLTVALHSVRRAKVAAGEFVAIFGAGTIGLLAGMAAFRYGGIPIMIDPLEQRLACAKALGFQIINPTKRDPEAATRDITDGKMPQVVIEASGASAAIQNCLRLASFAGRVAFTGYPKGETQLDTAVITRKELDVLGSRNSAREFPLAIEAVASGDLDVLKILTKTVSFSQIGEAIANISENPGNLLKISSVFDYTRMH